MNILDRIIGELFPKRGLERVRARALMRAYDGADTGRRSTNWHGRATSANTEIGRGIGSLRDRSRELVRNAPHANRAIEVIVTNVVGSGITPVSMTGSDGLDKRVTELWQEWQDQADVEGRLDFNAMQALACRSIIEGGEVVIQHIDATFKNVRSKIPAKLKLFEGDFIDQTREGLYAGIADAETKRARLGVGLGEYDRFTGLWMHQQHPGEATTVSIIGGGVSRFHPADTVLHVFKLLRAGQVRGVPWFAPMLPIAREFQDFIDAVIVKSRIEACYSGFITNSDELEQVMDVVASRGIDAANPDAMISALEPGTVKQLKSGQDIKFAAPSSTSQVEPIAQMCLYAMASSIGVTYDQMTSDLRGANYSSLRAGKLEFRANIESFQNLTFIPQLCGPVWERFIARATLVGELRPRKEGYPCRWVTPSWAAVNPRFDYEADEHAVRSGRTSPQNFIAAQGYDWRDIVDQIAEFQKYCDEKKVVLDIDSRQRTRAGSAQPAPAAPNGNAAPGEASATTPNPDDNLDEDNNPGIGADGEAGRVSVRPFLRAVR